MLTVETEKILLEFLNPLLSSVPFYTPLESSKNPVRGYMKAILERNQLKGLW